MNKQPDTTLHFYQTNFMHMALGATTRRTILRHQGQPLAEQHRKSGEDNALMLATDIQGSVLMAKDAQEEQSFNYTAFGDRPIEDAMDILASFNGEHRDSRTGVYLLGNGYRGYSPVLMRFQAPDSASPFGAGGLNAYMYCAGDPVNFNDPTGHAPWRLRTTPVFDQGIYRRRSPNVQATSSARTRNSTVTPGPSTQFTQGRPSHEPIENAGYSVPRPMDLSTKTEERKLHERVQDAINKDYNRDNKDYYTEKYRKYREFREAAVALIKHNERTMGIDTAKQRFFDEWPQEKTVRQKILSDLNKIRRRP